jgi:hypothetical protein
MIMVEKLQIVERAMQKLSRPDLHPEAVHTLRNYSPTMHPSWTHRSAPLRPQRGQRRRSGRPKTH